MPVLQPSSPAIVSVPARFASALPSSFTQDAASAPIFRALTAGTFGAGHMENGVVLSGHFGRSVATTIGWEVDEIPGLTELTNTVMTALSEPELAAIAQMFETLKPLLADALEPIVEAISESISGIPIIGWIAQIGFLTWKHVRNALEHGQDTYTENVALGYNRDADEDVAQAILDRLGGADWTPLFAPPPGRFYWNHLAYTSTGLVDGVQWGQLPKGAPGSASLRGVDTFDNALGLLPGVGDIAGYWQSPRNSRPGKDCSKTKSCWGNRSHIVSQGQLAPSATSLAGQVWANAQRPTPSLGRIDFRGVARRWQEYGQALTVFSSTAGGSGKTGRGEWLTKQINRGWKWYEGSSSYYDVAPSSVPKVWRQTGRLDDLIEYKCDIAWRNAVQAMQTHCAAYMTDDLPLVANDTGLKTILDRARLALVQGRPDVVLVDPSLVPEAGYRNAIFTAKAKAEGAQGGGPVPQRTPTPVDLPSTETEGSGGGVALVAAAVALAIVFAMRRRK